MADYSTELLGEEAMVAFGKTLGHAYQQAACESVVVIFLEGNLGMGKTTLSRGILQSFAHKGAVKSPTYTLVEPYELGEHKIYHFDLYRLGDPEELEYMGIRDYFEGQHLCLLEWADKGGPFLPVPDLEVAIELVKDGRKVQVNARTEQGESILQLLKQ